MDPRVPELQTDLLIVGASCGGVAAAMAAASAGVSCVLTEPTDWIGGQLTSQGVPPDENRWVESIDDIGATRLYKTFREGCRAWYRANRPLKVARSRDPEFNPGGGWVSRLCVEPRVAHEVLRNMLRPHQSAGRVTLLTHHTVVGADTEGDRIRSVCLLDRTGNERVIAAKMVLDATEDGELLELAHVEHAIGAEHRAVYGEMHGRIDRDDPTDQQGPTWCFAVEHREGEDHTIDRPAGYDGWARYVPSMAPGEQPWTGRLFSWTVPSHNESGSRDFPLVPWPDQPAMDEWELWRYRRIVDRAAYRLTTATAPPDVSLMNCVQIDYWREPTLGVTPEAREAAYAAAREQARSFLYWMQTEAPRHDGKGTGYPGLRLRGDELGTDDGFAKRPYIREPRRLLAMQMLTEAHVGTEQRRAERRPHMDATEFGTAEPFADSIGVGHYHIDLHPTPAGRNSVYVPAAPYRIPLGSLIPRRVRNLLAASKCLGVSHVVNGSTRVHHSEWGIGEAAGVLAAQCLLDGTEPHAVYEDRSRIDQVKQRLTARGAPLRWPWEQD
ncbi:MAG: FAD-dependent oxidoreductase [Planctomycetota bacterium]